MNCPKCDGDMWDNRERKTNPKAPDFKCKDQNCDGVIWPPLGGRGRAPQQRAAAPPPPKRSNGHASDDRSNRIERQHSQEMALRYFALSAYGKVPETKELKEMVSWFQRDISTDPARTKPEPTQQSQEPEQSEVPDEEIPF